MIMFLLQKFKMMTSPYAFLIFSKSLFSGLLGRGKKAKNGPKWQKIISLCILGTVSHMIVVFVTHVKWWYLQQLFFIFSKFWFFGFIKVCQKEIVVSNAFSSLYKMLSIKSPHVRFSSLPKNFKYYSPPPPTSPPRKRKSANFPISKTTDIDSI